MEVARSLTEGVAFTVTVALPEIGLEQEGAV